MSGYVRLSQICTDYVSLGQANSGYVRLVQEILR